MASGGKSLIRHFCERHRACVEGREWAMEHCNSLADVWRAARPDWVVWVATRPGVLTDKELRRFLCWSVRQVWDQLTDERSRHAVEVAERHMAGEATEQELLDARIAAVDAWSWHWASWVASCVVGPNWSFYRLGGKWAAMASGGSGIADRQAEWLRANTRPRFLDGDHDGWMI